MTNADTNTAAAQQRNIENAARAKNPMENIPEVLHYKTAKGEAVQEYSLYAKAKSDMDAKTLKWAFKLAERNVSPFYKELSMGWQPKVKQNDLNKSWARYLVALDNKKQAVAYAMFRFDLDYGSAVLYWYVNCLYNALKFV